MNINKYLKKTVVGMLPILIFTFTTKGQSVTVQNITGSDKLNTITTAVPFLLIAPDTRSGGMGDVGVATSPDGNCLHWNAAKMAFEENEMGISVSYTPWLRKLVPDINLSYLSFYKKVDKFQTFGASLRYFTLGDIQFTDEFGNNTVQFRPNEFAIDLGYARKLSDQLSTSMTIRYVNSNLTGGQNVQGSDSKPGRAVAADIAAYYHSTDLELGDKEAEYAAGLNISNIGNKMSYTQTSKTDFIPINMRLGNRLTIELDDYNQVSFALDLNKLLVPTPPLYMEDEDGRPVFDSEQNLVILSGKDPNRAVANGMFGSFTDAPGVASVNNGVVEIEKGSVFKEELREIMYSVGMEYWYDKQFAVRGGYFWEHELKGNRKFFTIGAGLRYNVFGLDFSYLIPAYFNSANAPAGNSSPLQNTLRFTLTFDFEAFNTQPKEVSP